jgi:DNA repair protein RAD7
VPKLKHLNLRNAGQIKDEVIDFVLERDVPLQSLCLEASNLVSDDRWRKWFAKSGHRMEAVKLAWLDSSLDDETVDCLVTGCPNLERLKLKKCFRIGDESLHSLGRLQHLQHLSLRFINPTSASALNSLISRVGRGLRTLSLERFENADDSTLGAIHETCTKLSKLRFTENDYCTDAAFAALFTDWPNPPLKFIDLSSTRDVDHTKPDGPEDPVGLASSGFAALMRHSGSRLEVLDISSCRHIKKETFAEVFDGAKQYPFLRDVNLSFLTMIDTPVMAGLFKSCPAMKKLAVFGCFCLTDLLVPAGVALIGLPNPLEEIVQEGIGEFMARL